MTQPANCRGAKVSCLLILFHIEFSDKCKYGKYLSSTSRRYACECQVHIIIDQGKESSIFIALEKKSPPTWNKLSFWALFTFFYIDFGFGPPFNLIEMCSIIDKDWIAGMTISFQLS